MIFIDCNYKYDSSLTYSDEFELWYKSFIDALEIMSEKTEIQCQILGYYNVARGQNYQLSLINFATSYPKVSRKRSPIF